MTTNSKAVREITDSEENPKTKIQENPKDWGWIDELEKKQEAEKATRLSVFDKLSEDFKEKLTTIKSSDFLASSYKNKKENILKALDEEELDASSILNILAEANKQRGWIHKPKETKTFRVFMEVINKNEAIIKKIKTELQKNSATDLSLDDPINFNKAIVKHTKIINSKQNKR